MKQFITEVNAVCWRCFEGPTYYCHEKVPEALIALASADKETKEGLWQIEGIKFDLVLSPKTTSNVLFAIGNDHRGTYYTAVRSALPFIIQVALFGNHIVARIVR